MTTIPQHVPTELVWDQDLATFAEATTDPHRAVSDEFHAGPDIRWLPQLGHGRQGWVVTRAALQAEVMMDPDNFSSHGGTSDLCDILGVPWRLNPLEIDPPHHMQFRQFLQPWFQPRAVARLDDDMRRNCRALLDSFADRGACEFSDDFGLRFPSQVFLQIMGMPMELLGQFLEWEHAIVRGATTEIRLQALRLVAAYLEEYFLEKRRNPTEGDLASYIASAPLANGQPLSHGDMMGMALVLYVGGLDTVASSIGWYLMHLARNPELQDRLRRQPELITGAVEDMSRAYGVSTSMRVCTRDLEFHGVAMKAGDLVSLPTYLASRDAQAFEDPHTVDPERRSRHLTFATGPHNCLGIHLARRELRIAIEEWLRRFENIRIADESQVQWAAPGVWGVTRLPLAWDLPPLH